MSPWEVEYTDEFESWWSSLASDAQESVAASVHLLEHLGPGLGFPHSSAVLGSRHGHLRELRTQHHGRPLRTLYAFDTRRCAILLLGGDKTGKPRWYEVFVPIADRLYDEHLEQLRREGLNDVEEIYRIAGADDPGSPGQGCGAGARLVGGDAAA